MVVLATADRGDRQTVRHRRSHCLYRIVLIDEQRVEQLLLAHRVLDLAECQMLMIEGVAVLPL
ncbi:Uncharacterised protein [Mycobacteroides abscessus subsp. abscessus]|nr:Uncharacterised protein [Mycobacteroides abscessus subsp. abscessus]